MSVTQRMICNNRSFTLFIIKYLNKGLGPIINASFLGAALPGCACSTMPIAKGLKLSGGSLGTVTSFIMASPLLAPQTIILTYGLLGMKFAVGRVFLTCHCSNPPFILPRPFTLAARLQRSVELFVDSKAPCMYA